jgi:hypothetical protein
MDARAQINQSTNRFIALLALMLVGAVAYFARDIDTSQIKPFTKPTVVRVTNGNGESYYVVRDIGRIYSFTFGDYFTQGMTGDRYKTQYIDQARKFETASMAQKWLNDYELRETTVESIDPEPALAKAHQ